MNTYPSYSGATTIARTNQFLRSVYNWMTIALALTGVTAFYVAYLFETSEAVRALLTSPLLIVLILAELGLVFFISARISKLQASTATGLFVLYSILNGVTLSFVFLAYSGESIAATFFICAGTFAACSIYGMVTKKDLTSLGGFMMMGLFGIIIASVVNIFVASETIHMVVSYLGVFVFIGLTAYDTQKLKMMNQTMPESATGSMIRKGAIMGALTLYLDFINLFLFLLRIFGGSRD